MLPMSFSSARLISIILSISALLWPIPDNLQHCSIFPYDRVGKWLFPLLAPMRPSGLFPLHGAVHTKKAVISSAFRIQAAKFCRLIRRNAGIQYFLDIPVHNLIQFV